MEWLRGSGPSERILIVDDEPECRETLADVLQAEGYRVSCASNGQKALDRLQSEPPPDLILLDLMMPGVDGWEFRRRQQEDPALAAIPVVVVSALGSTLEEVTSVDAVAYLLKPFSLDDLLHTVRRCCRGPADGERPAVPGRLPDEPPARQRLPENVGCALGERRDEAA